MNTKVEKSKACGENSANSLEIFIKIVTKLEEIKNVLRTKAIYFPTYNAYSLGVTS